MTHGSLMADVKGKLAGALKDAGLHVSDTTRQGVLTVRFAGPDARERVECTVGHSGIITIEGFARWRTSRFVPKDKTDANSVNVAGAVRAVRRRLDGLRQRTIAQQQAAYASDRDDLLGRMVRSQFEHVPGAAVAVTVTDGRISLTLELEADQVREAAMIAGTLRQLRKGVGS
jgi:hypothetical protein